MDKAHPPTHFLVVLVIMEVLHALLPGYRYWSFPLALVGGVLLVVGALLNVIAERVFKMRRTAVTPFEESTALITAFPYAFSRNPMYLGMGVMLVGVVLILGTTSCVVPVAVFAYTMDRVFIRVEEQMLADKFGEEWEKYRSDVRRWF